ncbi:uncharacterized protein [Antedon mediterranea]|uniref:uncharacterized protein n=1 Tax=Antedon mediterranea TaxID=105859 RepID=UPI003AF56560
MTLEALYIVVFDLSVNLEDRAIFIDANGDERKHHWTNLQFILSYILSVYSHSRDIRKNKDKRVHEPTILIVGTHKAELGGTEEEQNAEAKSKFEKLKHALGEKLKVHVYNTYFAIENSKETTDESFSKLKKVIDELMETLERPVPLKWMRFRCDIHKLRREKHFSLCHVEELKKLASKNGIADEKQQSTLLNFLYDLGEIVYRPDNKLLEDKAVLDPMRLVKIVTAFVTVIKQEDPPAMDIDAFANLDKGILEEDLLRELWKEHKVDEGKNFKFLVALMIQLGFICERKTTSSQDVASTSTESVGKQSFFVPLRLAFKTSSEVKAVPDEFPAISIYYDFKGYLPDVLFPYMIIDFLNKFQKKDVDPILSYNHAELYFDQDHHLTLSLVKFVTTEDERKFLLKVTIKRTNAPNEASNEEPSSEACKEVLLTIQKSIEPSKDGGRRGIQYERCMLCDVCSDNTSERKHIQNLDDFQYEKLTCTKTGKSVTMDVKRYKQLFVENRWKVITVFSFLIGVFAVLINILDGPARMATCIGVLVLILVGFWCLHHQLSKSCTQEGYKSMDVKRYKRLFGDKSGPKERKGRETDQVFILFADKSGPKERKGRETDQGNTMADSESLNNFRDLKAGLSRCFDGDRYHWLRFLLFDKLDVGDITNQDFNGNNLLNALEDKDFISPTNVNLLLEIVNTSEMAQAKDLVSKYMSENKVQNRHTGKTKLSSYRKRLFKALKQVDPDALRNVTAYYKLTKYNFSNVWNAVLRLEIEQELSDDLDKIQMFAGRLSKVASNILLGDSEKK